MPTDGQSDSALPLTRRPGGIELRVRLTPRAAQKRIGPIETGADGVALLKVAVTAVPEAGKANAQMIGLLAKAWRLPKSAFRLAGGTTVRNKTVQIDVSEDGLKRVTQMLEKADG